MGEAAQSATSARPGFGDAGVASAVRREILTWAWLAVGALAVAGVFALLLALSRIPGMDEAPFWPLEFFYKGLVIHVVFSLVIWLLGIFAFLVSVATLEARGEAMRAAPLGRIGQGLVICAFPCLFVPAFLNASQPELTNYVPLIRHPVHDLGLVFLALGVLSPVARIGLNLGGGKRPPLMFAMSVAGLIYVVALALFAIAFGLLARRVAFAPSHDQLLWGGGHVLQFVYAILLIVNWRILARRSLGEAAVPEGAFRVSVGIVGALALAAPFFYAIFAPFSEEQRQAFRFLQFGLSAPTLAFAIPLVRNMRGERLPWRDPAFFALAMSLALFALGGVMGFLITGSDTRTPAHYHAVITAVSVSSAGMLLTFGLDKVGRKPAPAGVARMAFALYGGGQFVASIAMFVAGGYGALRKTPDGVSSLDAVAAAGMAVHGIASIFTILGGAAFVIVAIRALMRPTQTMRASP